MATRNIEDLHPKLQPLCKAFLRTCADNGIAAILTCTYRSPKEQNDLYAQGRTRPGNIITNARAGQSKHNVELKGKPASKAFDIAVKSPEGKLIWDTTHPYWSTVGDIGRALGLNWGGDWKSIKDYPHFEIR